MSNSQSESILNKIFIRRTKNSTESIIREYLSRFLNVDHVESIDLGEMFYPCYIVTFKVLDPLDQLERFLRELFCGKVKHEIETLQNQLEIKIVTSSSGILTDEEFFINCDIFKLNDVNVVKTLHSYLKEYTYRKTPEGFVIKYREDDILQPLPFGQFDLFESPAEIFPIKNTNQVYFQEFVNNQNRKSNNSPFHMMFKTGRLIETTVLNKLESIKNSTGSVVRTQTYIFCSNGKVLADCLRDYGRPRIDNYYYFYYSVIGRTIGMDEFDHFKKMKCQVLSCLIVENEDWNCLLKAIQIIKKFSSKPFLKEEYRYFNVPLEFKFFQVDDGKMKVVKYGTRWNSYILERERPFDLDRNIRPYGFMMDDERVKKGVKQFYRTFRGPEAGSEFYEELANQIKDLSEHKKKKNMEWLCKLKVGKVFFWSKVLFPSMSRFTEISFEELKKARNHLTQFYKCDLNEDIHEYVRVQGRGSSKKGKKTSYLQKISEKKDFKVTVVDCLIGKEYELNFLIGTEDGVLEFDKLVDNTRFAKVLIAHSYSFELDYEISFYCHTEIKDVKGPLKWIVDLFHGKKINEIENLILITNPRFIFFYDTNFEDIRGGRYVHSKSGFEIEIFSETKKATTEEEESVEHTTSITPPKFVMKDGSIPELCENLMRFANELMKRAKKRGEKRRKRSQSKRHKRK